MERQLASIRKELQELRRGRSAQPDAKRSKPDRVVVAAFPLKHLKSAEVAEMLQELLGKKNAFVGVDGRDNAVVVRTTEYYMATVRRVIKKVDVKDE